MTSYVRADVRREVYDRADGRCEYCLIHERDTFLGCQVDHIVSEKHGGANDASNLALRARVAIARKAPTLDR
jgi:5-methylcytosine-specific restriction endonuclease McrA